MGALADRGGGSQSQPAIFELFANTIDAKSDSVEFHAIANVEREDLFECRQHRLWFRIPEPQQIEVASAPKWILKPAHH